MDQNININVRSSSDWRGRSILIGMVVLWLLMRWWLCDSLSSIALFATARDVPSDGFEGFATISVVLIKIAVDLLVAFGAMATMHFSGLWGVLWAVGLELYQSMKSRTQAAGIARASTDAAVSAVVDAATASTMQQLPKALAAIQNLNTRVKALEAHREPDLFTPPAPAPAVDPAPAKRRSGKSKPDTDGGAK